MSVPKIAEDIIEMSTDVIFMPPCLRLVLCVNPPFHMLIVPFALQGEPLFHHVAAESNQRRRAVPAGAAC